eukprot:CAMPEP_0198229966 /NCGR_PEP_ID=MMETSP1445-20131203/114390_1 /TAXON_ID=36898 /ORGANISM="Pyramimonas sp., Strain CCMP2087" /LENGTH=219 /DNA_ID=CAMNT_0043910451 /DNA_START=1706 /DNA_END=2365 /DNA_ORIENTATION=+
MATSMNAISCPVVSRPGSAVLRSVRKPTAPKRNMKVMAGPIGDTTGMSAEQINFLKRRAGLIPDPLAAPGKAAAPAKGAAPAAYKAPAAAAPAGGFSQIQLDFMNRKKAEASGQPFRGYDASPAPAAAAPAYKAPAAAAPAYTPCSRISPALVLLPRSSSATYVAAYLGEEAAQKKACFSTVMVTTPTLPRDPEKVVEEKVTYRSLTWSLNLVDLIRTI